MNGRIAKSHSILVQKARKGKIFTSGNMAWKEGNIKCTLRKQ